MLHIKPVQPKDASASIAQIYKEIQDVFEIDTVPLLFQYMANYEHYFLFIWDRMKININSKDFQNYCDTLGTFSAKAIIEIYRPSLSLLDFIKRIHALETQEISTTVNRLMKVNIILFLLTLDLREGMKSIFITTDRLTQYASTRGESFTDFMRNEEEVSIEGIQDKTVQEATNMLAPLFGTNAIVVSHYPDFFGLVAREMERLKKEQKYLEKRVEMEHMGLAALSSFPQPLGCSFQEFMTLVKDKPHVRELLQLLTDAFPSQFPHLVLTTSLMQYALHLKENSIQDL